MSKQSYLICLFVNHAGDERITFWYDHPDFELPANYVVLTASIDVDHVVEVEKLVRMYQILCNDLLRLILAG
jgi:hypothetical protein